MVAPSSSSKNFQVNITFNVAGNLTNAVTQVNNMNSHTTALGANIGRTNTQMGGVVKSATAANVQLSSMVTTSIRLAAAGAAVNAMIMGSVNQYVKAYGSNEAVSRSWINATEKISFAYQRVGRVIATELLPLFKQVAQLATNIATFVEKNPQLAKAVSLGAIGLSAIGSGAVALSMGATVVKNIGSMLGLGGIMAGGGGMAGAGGAAYGVAGGLIGPAARVGLTALGVGSSVLGGIGLGFGINEYAANRKNAQGERVNPNANFNEIFTVLTYELGKIAPAIKDLMGTIGLLTGALSPAQKAAIDMKTAEDNLARARRDAVAAQGGGGGGESKGKGVGGGIVGGGQPINTTSIAVKFAQDFFDFASQRVIEKRGYALGDVEKEKQVIAQREEDIKKAEAHNEEAKAYNKTLVDKFGVLGSIGKGEPLVAVPEHITPKAEKEAGFIAKDPRVRDAQQGVLAAGQNITKIADTISDATWDQMKQMDAKRNAEQLAQQEYVISTTRMERDFKKQQLYEQVDYDKSRGREADDYHRNRGYAEDDFYRQREYAAKDFGIQMVRMEQDFQRQRSRQAFDHTFDLFQISMSGDAMQYWLSQRQFKIDQDRQLEDYNIQRTRAQEDFDRTYGRSEAEYKITRDRQDVEYKIMRERAQVDFDLNRARTKDNYQTQRDDMQFNFDRQNDLRTAEYKRQITLQTDNQDTRKALQDSFTKAQIDSDTLMRDAALHTLQSLDSMAAPGGFHMVNAQGQTIAEWIASMMGSGENVIIPPHATGGYVSAGLWQGHDNEFVLTAQTTKVAEQFAKGRLTQDAMVSMMGGGGGKSLVYHDNRVFGSKLTVEDRQEIQRDTESLLRELFK